MRTLELALSLLAVLSAQDDGFGAVLGLTAHEFDPGTRAQPALTPWVGKLNQLTLDGACPRNGEVLAIVNDVTKSVRASGNYRDATNFGNKVDIEVARRVNFREILISKQKSCSIRVEESQTPTSQAMSDLTFWKT